MLVIRASLQQIRRPANCIFHYHDFHRHTVFLVNELQNTTDVFVRDGNSGRVSRKSGEDVSLVTLLRSLIKKRERAVKIFLSNGIVLVIMTLGAFKREGEECFAEGSRSVGHVFNPVLLVN